MLQGIFDVRLPSLAATVSPHLPYIRLLSGKPHDLRGVTLDASFPNVEERHCRIQIEAHGQASPIAVPPLEEGLRTWIEAIQHYWRFRGVMLDIQANMEVLERHGSSSSSLEAPRQLVESILDASEVMAVRQGLIDGTLDFGKVKPIGPQAAADGPHRMSFFVQARQDELLELQPFEFGFYISAVRVDHPVLQALTSTLAPRIQPLIESWFSQNGWQGVSYARLTLPLNPRLERALGRIT